MKKYDNYVSYEKALTDNEILLYSKIIDQFKKGELNFRNLKNIFLGYGVTIEVTPNKFSDKLMAAGACDDIKKRISEENYLYSDIDFFILNSTEFKNIIFRLDLKAIQLLANAGISEYQEYMISILMTQLKFSLDNDETSIAERRKWQRRINELNLQLSKKDKCMNVK